MPNDLSHMSDFPKNGLGLDPPALARLVARVENEFRASRQRLTPMRTPNELPPLPPDAGDRLYALLAVRGVLEWHPVVDGISGRMESGGPKINTVWIVAPGNERYLVPPQL